MLVLSKEVDSCVAWPYLIRNKTEVINHLTYLLGIPADELKDKLSSSRFFVWLKRKIAPSIATKIKVLHLPGVGLVKESKRFYPEGDLLWHVLGQVNLDNYGLSGIELAYDDLIRGEPVQELKERDGRGQKIANRVTVADEEGKPKNIVLTIDKVIQHIAERELFKTYSATLARKAILIVQEVSTGEILAWVCYPTSSEEEWKRTPELLNNPGISDTFEPGSTFKVIPACFALEENLTTSEEKYFCENGLFKLYGIKIRDHEKRGILTFKQVLAYSSNIGMAKLGLRMNKEKFYQFISNFGFGCVTGLGLAGESPGLLLLNQHQLTLPILCYGQGIGVTAIQLLNAYSAIANQGMLMEPQIVKEIRTRDGKVLRRYTPVPIRRVISERTVSTTTEILEDAVEWGTGIKAKIKGYRVAGKTGTAQKFDPLTKKYSDTKHIASFCGFFPLPQPRIAILIVIDEPQTQDYWGGSLAAPVFARVAEQVIQYLHIPPAEEKYAQIKGTP